MRKIIVATLIAASFVASAERLKLKYAATVIELDDSGRKVGTRQLKAGTEITIAEPAAAAPATPSGGRLSGISPAQFIAEKLTSPTTFYAEVSLDPDPVIFNDRIFSEETHWCARGSIFGKSRSTSKTITGFAAKNSPVGKALFAMLKDGEEHTVNITIKCLQKSDRPTEVEVVAIKEVSADKSI